MGIRALCALSLLLPFATAFGARADHPNIVLIMVDDMGYGDAGAYNPDAKIPTPHIDRLAAEGMRFTDAHAAGPLCHMSRYGLLTGEYPFRVRVDDWRERALIAEGRTTIASLLRDQGYRTHMVGKWHLGFHEQGYDQPLPGGPVDRGFDTFFGIRASTDIPPYFYIYGDRAVEPPTDHIEENHSEGWAPVQGAFWRAGGIAPHLDLADVLPRFTEEAFEVIHGAKTDQPFFLYLAYPAPHTPWLPSKAFEGQSGAGMYGDFMMMVDAMVGRVIAALETRGLLENTLLIFTSDNGPYWRDEDVDRFDHDSAGGFRGMKGDAWEAGHRVPFIVRWPGKVAPGSTSGQLIGFTDLLATFAALTSAKVPAGEAPDSVSFLPVLLGDQPEDKPVREAWAMQAGSGAMLYRAGHWKLIDALGSGGFSQPRREDPVPGGPTGQLYNLATDPAETTNLYLDHPDIVARLTAELARVREAQAE